MVWLQTPGPCAANAADMHAGAHTGQMEKLTSSSIACIPPNRIIQSAQLRCCHIGLQSTEDTHSLLKQTLTNTLALGAVGDSAGRAGSAQAPQCSSRVDSACCTLGAGSHAAIPRSTVTFLGDRVKHVACPAAARADVGVCCIAPSAAQDIAGRYVEAFAIVATQAGALGLALGVVGAALALGPGVREWHCVLAVGCLQVLDLDVAVLVIEALTSLRAWVGQQ